MWPSWRAAPGRGGKKKLWYTARVATRIAINGFGRIGRPSFKIALTKPELEVVAINDLADPPTLAHLIKYDTVYGRYAREVSADASALIIDGQRFPVTAEKDPARLPWKDLEVEVVLECTGRFTTKEGAAAHLKAGAKRVIISAPTESIDVDTVLFGVNEDRLADQEIIANGSCTTNCVAPVVALLHSELGVEGVMMSTIHAVTATQNLVDGPSQDLRRARAAPWNIIPTSTGAEQAVVRALPEVANRFGALSLRVPIATVSLADFVVLVSKMTTTETVNDIFRRAAGNPLTAGIIAVTEVPAVSSDFIGDPHSAVVDCGLTHVVGERLVKVVAWYDNEWGYANRLVEQAIAVGKSLAS